MSERKGCVPICRSATVNPAIKDSAKFSLSNASRILLSGSAAAADEVEDDEVDEATGVVSGCATESLDTCHSIRIVASLRFGEDGRPITTGNTHVNWLPWLAATNVVCLGVEAL